VICWTSHPLLPKKALKTANLKNPNPLPQPYTILPISKISDTILILFSNLKLAFSSPREAQLFVNTTL